MCDLRVLRDSSPFLSSVCGDRMASRPVSVLADPGIPSLFGTSVTIAGRCRVSPIFRLRPTAVLNPRKTERIGKAVTARCRRHDRHNPTTFCRFASPTDQTTLADRSGFTMTDPRTTFGSLRAGVIPARHHHALRPDHFGKRDQRLGRGAGGRSTPQASGNRRASEIGGRFVSGRTSRSRKAVDGRLASSTLNRPDGSSPPVADHPTTADRARS